MENIKNKIICGDCEQVLKSFPDGIIDLWIDSPPYFCVKDYSKDIKNDIGNINDYDLYLEKMESIFKEVYRTLKEGKVFALNISPVLIEGKRINIPIDLYNLCIKIGFKWNETIIWNKPWGAARLRCGNYIQRGGIYKPNLLFEYVFIFSKNEINTNTQVNIKKPVDLMYDVWLINPETGVNHDAPFPRSLSDRLIKLYSSRGDLVGDFCAGSLTVGESAKLLGRDYVLIEINQDFIDRFKSRLNQNSLKDFL